MPARDVVPSGRVAAAAAVVVFLLAVFPALMKPTVAPTAIPGFTFHRRGGMQGAPAKPKPFGKHPSPERPHPHMAPQGMATIHADGASSDVHEKGPLGRNVSVVSRVGSQWPGGMCATLTFSRDGLLIALCASLAGFEIHLMAPRTLELLAVYSLPQRPSTFAAIVTLDPERIMLDTSGGAYYYLDNKDRVVLADAAQHVQRIAHRKLADGKYEFFNDGDWDVSNHVPHDCFNWNNWFPAADQCDPITAVTPDHAGNIWWVTRRGIVGVVNPNTNVVKTVDLKEEMQNGITVGSDCVHLVTTFALYCMEADGAGVPTTVWSETYDRGTFQKVGMLSVGSGTAPTLFDAKYATITDNNDERINLLIYDRNLDPKTGKGRPLPQGQKRLVCTHPLFEKDKSASDNSMIAVGNTVIMENNFGFRNGIQQTAWGRDTIPGGIVRVDLDPKTKTCKTVWENDERAPSCVAKLSAANGLAYYSTFDEVDGEIQWYLTAIDAHTGKTAFKVPTGVGRYFDNNWGPVTLGPDGTAYIGVLRGIVAIFDQE